MRWSILSREDRETSAWPGGTTTQLYIHPSTERYADKRFALRISCATVELETSVFTALPGYTRHIMPLRGTLRLVHQGQYETTLAQYETDTFDGAWDTVSHGRCVDFNLMLGAGWRGGLSARTAPCEICCASGLTALYVQADTRLLLQEANNAPQQITLAAEALFVLWRSDQDMFVTLTLPEQAALCPAILAVVGEDTEERHGSARNA